MGPQDVGTWVPPRAALLAEPLWATASRPGEWEDTLGVSPRARGGAAVRPREEG